MITVLRLPELGTLGALFSGRTFCNRKATAEQQQKKESDKQKEKEITPVSSVI